MRNKMAAPLSWRGLLCLAAVCCCASGQMYYGRTSMDLCERMPTVEPNGEHLDKPGNNITIYTSWWNNTVSQARHCLMRFSTCNYCRLRVRTNIPINFMRCRDSPAYYDYNGWCASGCSYLHMYDQFYSNQTAKSFSSESWKDDYKTESRYLYVIACANRSLETEVIFNITITSEEKTQVFKGTSGTVGRPFSFTSPFFPDPYVLNSEIYQFIFEAATQDEFVTISFDDWHLSPTSTVVFEDANYIGAIPGTLPRPWVVSNKYSLKMTFDTGQYKVPGTFRAFTGFKATYTFHEKGDRAEIGNIMTICGDRIVSPESGNISFNPSSNGIDLYYDCIWVIQKNASYESLMVKVINFSTRDDSNRLNQPNLLEIRDGLTSEGILIASAVAGRSLENAASYDAYESDTGFYIRLKGHYPGRRDFVLAYTAFNIVNCRNMFECDNHRCILWNLRCNGFDNCGDNSDEDNAFCGGGVSAGSGSDDHYSLSVGIIIPLVVSIFLIIVVCLLIIIIRRCRHLSRQARRAERTHRQINSVSGSVVCSRRRHNRRRGPRGGANGHAHDLPPSYEDVLSSTPIGYLNLGFADAYPMPHTGLIQPPSYEEAISPTSPDAPFGLGTAYDPDLSSDSSSPNTSNRFNMHSSYSSDDTQASHDQHRRVRRERHQRSMSSSSDSSMEIQFGVGGQRNNDGGGGGGDGSAWREETRQTNSPSTRRSIAKPDDSDSARLAVCLTNSPAVHKDDQHKETDINSQPPHKDNSQRNHSATPAIITEGLSPANAAVPALAGNNRNTAGEPAFTGDDRNDGRPNSSATGDRPNADLMCRVENSPVVLAPAFYTSRRQESPQKTSSRPAHTERDDDRNDGKGRYDKSTSSNTHHIRRDPRTHKLVHTPLKSLSRSMNDLRRMDDDGSGRERSLSASRHLSQSMENVFEGSSSRGGEWEPRRRTPVDMVQSYPHLPSAAVSGSRQVDKPNERHGDERQTPSRGEDQPRPVPRPRRSLSSGRAASGEKRAPDHERDAFGHTTFNPFDHGNMHMGLNPPSSSSSPPHDICSQDRRARSPDGPPAGSEQPRHATSSARNPPRPRPRGMTPDRRSPHSTDRPSRPQYRSDPHPHPHSSDSQPRPQPSDHHPANPRPHQNNDRSDRGRPHDGRSRPNEGRSYPGNDRPRGHDKSSHPEARHPPSPSHQYPPGGDYRPNNAADRQGAPHQSRSGQSQNNPGVVSAAAPQYSRAGSDQHQVMPRPSHTTPSVGGHHRSPAQSSHQPYQGTHPPKPRSPGVHGQPRQDSAIANQTTASPPYSSQRVQHDPRQDRPSPNQTTVRPNPTKTSQDQTTTGSNQPRTGPSYPPAVMNLSHHDRLNTTPSYSRSTEDLSLSTRNSANPGVSNASCPTPPTSQGRLAQGGGSFADTGYLPGSATRSGSREATSVSSVPYTLQLSGEEQSDVFV